MFNVNNDHERRVYVSAMLSHVDSYDRAPEYTKNQKAMELHSVAVEWDMPALLAQPTNISACREQHYALNRVNSYTAAAMVADFQGRTEAAEKCRAMAAAWYAYFNNEDRRERAGIEDDERCARAEAAEAAELEEWYR